MNCTELDLAIEEGVRAVQTDVGFGALVVLGGLASVSLLLFGESIARPMAGVIAFSVTTVVLFGVTSITIVEQSLPCLARVVVSLTGGLAMAALAWCLLKGGLFVLGAAAFGTVTHFVYHSLPVAVEHEPPFVILGQSGYYYIAVGIAGIGGAVVSVVMKKQFMRLTSALVGGGGLALTTHLVSSRVGEEIPSIVLVAVLLVSTGVGVVFQHYFTYWKKKRKRRREESK